MAKVVTWDTSVTSLEEGKELTVTAEGFASNEKFTMFIQKPDGSYFNWELQADNSGKVSKQIMLDSGLGQYIFCLDATCGHSSPRCRHVNLCPCNVDSSKKCDIKVSGPDRILRNTAVVYEVTGLSPSRYISAKVSSNTQTGAFYSGSSDVDGKFLFEFQHALPGVYSVTFSDGTCVSSPHIIEVISSMNEMPIVMAVDTNYCAEPTEFTLRFDKSVYGFNEAGTLKTTLKNHSAYARTVAIAVVANAPGAQMYSDLFPGVVELPGYGTAEYVIYFKTGTADTVYAASVSGSYSCGGQVYAVNGAAANVTIGNGTGFCNAVLQFFGNTSGSGAVEKNKEVEITATLLNTGNVTIASAELGRLELPTGAVMVTPLPAKFDPIPVGESKSVKLKLKFVEAGAFTVRLPAGGISYSCGTGIPTPVNSAGYVSFSVA